MIGEWDGSGTTSAPAGLDRVAGERCRVAVPNRSRLGFSWEDFSLKNVRLEHELQTVAGQQRPALPRFLRLLTVSARLVPVALSATGTHGAR
jgi:hypothetical protein